MEPSEVFRECPQDDCLECAAASDVTWIGGLLSLSRSSYRQVGIKLFAVLTSSTTVGSVLQLYGRDITSSGFFLVGAVGMGLEKLKILVEVCFAATLSL